MTRNVSNGSIVEGTIETKNFPEFSPGRIFEGEKKIL